MRKRSKYRPKVRYQDPLSYVLNGFMPVVTSAPNIITTVKIMNHGAIEALRTGQANWDDISALVVAFNVALGLTSQGIGVEHQQSLHNALGAALAIENRGVWVPKGAELTAVNLGMEIHDAQLEVATVEQVDKALKFVQIAIQERKEAVRKQKATACTA